jgi:hypothetical protein
MDDIPIPAHTAFLGSRHLASGRPEDVARAAKRVLDDGATDAILIFDDTTGRRLDLDLAGPWDHVVARLEALRLLWPSESPTTAPRPRARGRPKLGVVSKEVTLLPRHWAWLGTQRGGASATLRRLVEEARKKHEGRDHVRRAQDAAYRFMTAMVGDEPGFEEALRALYAGNEDRFRAESEGWPPDLRDHSRRLAGEAFPRTSEDDGTIDERPH